jgi:predicted hotdog family 3-hydroxylacyl-ACP dehydratase
MLSNTAASTHVSITAASLFYVPGRGVPASTSLEYIGQTAALIGLYATEQRTREQRAAAEASATGEDGGQEDGNDNGEEGFLLASRSMNFVKAWFTVGEELVVSARQTGDVGAGLATFEGTVESLEGEPWVTGSLSVWRGKPGQQGSA